MILQASTPDLKTSFLTYYIRSLAERTRVEKSGTKFGFDWIIYNLGLANGWSPHRLPFIRGGASEFSQTKTENEFGIDLAFLSADKRQLFIFVLKDEVLKSATWTVNDFDTDLRRAAAPALKNSETQDVTEVTVILAYNKDEDHAGIELYDRQTAALGTTIGDRASLKFERWNLTRITEDARDKLLSPSLLPQGFFSHFSYLCAQVADFQHGSDEWITQLIPSWRRFLTELLKGKPDERAVRLLPVALIILREHGHGNPTIETGWIDLVEWAVLASWEVHRKTTNRPTRKAVEELWLRLYLTELERYYGIQQTNLSVEGSLEKHGGGGFIDAIASAVVAHWHVARLGILALSLAEIMPADNEEQASARAAGLGAVAHWLLALMHANPGARRPLLDIHHIEAFLIWRTLWQSGEDAELYRWLVDLQNRLFTRRCGQAELPFLNGCNSLESVFEFVARGEKPYDFCDKSSVFVVCLLELACGVLPENREELLNVIYRRLALATADCGTPVDGCEPLDLMHWVPPKDWIEGILTKNLGNAGECISLYLFPLGSGGKEEGAMPTLFGRIEQFVKVTREQRPFEWPEEVPASLITLACLKHASPLPPELWRSCIFSPPAPSSSSVDE